MIQVVGQTAEDIKARQQTNMGLFSLGNSQKRNVDIRHEKYGVLRYLEDDDGFACLYSGIKFILHPDKDGTIDHLYAYMEEISSRIDRIKADLDTAKSKMIAEVGGVHRDEILSLAIELISLSRMKNGSNYCFITLTGSDPLGDMRAWRFEYIDHTPTQLGFDS